MTKVLNTKNAHKELEDNNDLALNNLRLGCEEVLDDWRASKMNKRRLVEHFFQKFLDHMPNGLLSKPMNEFIEEYLNFALAKEGKEEQIMIIDESVCDRDEIQNTTTNSGKSENLTSTVKKTKSNKVDFNKQKLHDVINEHSIIQTPHINTDETITMVNKQDLAVRVIYFLDDMTQINVKFREMRGVDLSIVHDKCRDDVKAIISALKNESK